MLYTARSADRWSRATPAARLNVRADWVALQACVAECALSAGQRRAQRPASRDAATPKPSDAAPASALRLISLDTPPPALYPYTYLVYRFTYYLIFDFFSKRKIISYSIAYK